MINFAQIITQTSEGVVEQASLLTQSAPPVVIALVVFTLLRFVFKLAFITVIIATVAALFISGIISFSIV